MNDSDARARLATAFAGLKNAQENYNAIEQGGTQAERLALGGETAKAQIDRDQAQQDLNALKKLQSSGAASASEVAAAQERLDSDNAVLQISSREKPAATAQAISVGPRPRSLTLR